MLFISIIKMMHIFNGEQSFLIHSLSQKNWKRIGLKNDKRKLIEQPFSDAWS